MNLIGNTCIFVSNIIYIKNNVLFYHTQTDYQTLALSLLPNTRRCARRMMDLRCITKQHSMPNQMMISPIVRVAQKNEKAIQIENTMLDSSTSSCEYHGFVVIRLKSRSALTVSSDVTHVTITRKMIMAPISARFRRLNGLDRSICHCNCCKACTKFNLFVSKQFLFIILSVCAKMYKYMPLCIYIANFFFIRMAYIYFISGMHARLTMSFQMTPISMTL